MKPLPISDDQLVEQARGGDRDAFSLIVKKYQSLICALTYSTCGDLHASEDLAQMTFITAWSEMPKLQEPSKLKLWLCGIARNLAKNSFRKYQYAPIIKAQSLDTIRDLPAESPSPCDAVISKEEETILWQTISELPPMYREPLVLFYRQHQSAAEVADALDMTEDAVHQRLSRGRTMLTERIAKFVEKTLSNTGPSKAFGIAIMSAMPAATTGKAAGVGVTTIQAGATAAKATSLGALFQTIVMFTPVAILGGYLGQKMNRDIGGLIQQRKSVTRFWRIVAISFISFVGLPLFAAGLWIVFRVQIPKETVFTVLKIWCGILYGVVLSALGFWLWQRQKKNPAQPTAGNMQESTAQRLAIWVLIPIIGLACLLIAIRPNWKVRQLSVDQVRQIVLDTGTTPVQYSILQSKRGNRSFRIQLREDGALTELSAPYDNSTLALIKERGFPCPIYVQGRDYEILGWPGYLLTFFCVFFLAVGIVILLKQLQMKCLQFSSGR